MSHCPQELHYTKTHEWVRDEGDNIITIGVTDYALHMMGDLVFIELPELNKTIQKGDEVAVVESVKSASDVYSPFSGEVIDINEELSASPEQVNQDPYGKGWIFKIKISDRSQIDELLDAQSYLHEIEED